MRCWLCMRSTKCQWTTSGDILILIMLVFIKEAKDNEKHTLASVFSSKTEQIKWVSVTECWNLQLPAVNCCDARSLLNGHCVFFLIELAHLHVCLNILTRHMVATLPCLHVQGSMETWIWTCWKLCVIICLLTSQVFKPHLKPYTVQIVQRQDLCFDTWIGLFFFVCFVFFACFFY